MENFYKKFAIFPSLFFLIGFLSVLGGLNFNAGVDVALAAGPIQNSGKPAGTPGPHHADPGHPAKPNPHPPGKPKPKPELKPERQAGPAAAAVRADQILHVKFAGDQGKATLQDNITDIISKTLDSENKKDDEDYSLEIIVNKVRKGAPKGGVKLEKGKKKDSKSDEHSNSKEHGKGTKKPGPKTKPQFTWKPPQSKAPPKTKAPFRPKLLPKIKVPAKPTQIPVGTTGLPKQEAGRNAAGAASAAPPVILVVTTKKVETLPPQPTNPATTAGPVASVSVEKGSKGGRSVHEVPQPSIIISSLGTAEKPKAGKSCDTTEQEQPTTEEPDDDVTTKGGIHGKGRRVEEFILNNNPDAQSTAATGAAGGHTTAQGQGQGQGVTTSGHKAGDEHPGTKAGDATTESPKQHSTDNPGQPGGHVTGQPGDNKGQPGNKGGRGIDIKGGQAGDNQGQPGDNKGGQPGDHGDNKGGDNSGKKGKKKRRKSKEGAAGDNGLRLTQDSKQNSVRENINTKTQELIPLHPDLGSMQREIKVSIDRVEANQNNAQRLYKPWSAFDDKDNDGKFVIDPIAPIAPINPLQPLAPVNPVAPVNPIRPLGVGRN